MPPAKSSTKKKPAGGPAPRRAAEAAVPQSSLAPSLPPALTNPDAVTTYKSLYDVLGRAYWESSDLTAKDTIQGARDSIYEILTDLNAAKLEANTALFLSLTIKIRDSNKALDEIKEKINSITKNISTASSVIAAITKVVSIAPTLL
ncbi:hypothetical protein [Edaphobacter modestus]|uniref:Uncharacterized protein n=1 Tax=Edaphobacter modestus TaxID=388466 RepID=A0A4Q7YYW1_9BACT|nr:hypothetical protein [Edaphobacter modestus]RZU42339.1 hypothetical protein BDD14_3904 [Edaphobacter modestus]